MCQCTTIIQYNLPLPISSWQYNGRLLCGSFTGYTSGKNTRMTYLKAEWAHSLVWVPQDVFHCHSITTYKLPRGLLFLCPPKTVCWFWGDTHQKTLPQRCCPPYYFFLKIDSSFIQYIPTRVSPLPSPPSSSITLLSPWFTSLFLITNSFSVLAD